MVNISDFFNNSIISLLVIFWLSIYLILTFWIFIYKSMILRSVQERENISLELLLSDEIDKPKSAVFSNMQNKNILSKEMLNIWKNQVLKNSSSGIVFLSIVSSTAPFIGLFGTVIEILEAFSTLGVKGNASFDIIAPIISHALIATAWGILSAIPAYSFYLILKRKISVLSICLQSQIDVVMSNKEQHGRF